MDLPPIHTFPAQKYSAKVDTRSSIRFRLEYVYTLCKGFDAGPSQKKRSGDAWEMPSQVKILCFGRHELLVLFVCLWMMRLG